MRIPVSDYGITIRKKINIITAVTVGEVNEDCAFVVRDEESGYIIIDKGITYLVTGNCVTFLVSKEFARALESEDVSEIILTDQGNVFVVKGKGEALLIVSKGTVVGANEIGKYVVTDEPRSILEWNRYKGTDETKRGVFNRKRSGKSSGRSLRETFATLFHLSMWLVVIIDTLLLLR